MKKFYKIPAAIFIAAVLFSCNQKKIEVTFIGEIRARRTFANIQFIKDEKAQDKYIAEQERSKPQVYDFSPKDSVLIKQFQKLGLIENEEYQEKNFKPLTEKDVNFGDSANRIYPIKFYDDMVTGTTHFKIFFFKDSIDFDTEASPLQDLNYAFLDVIPGGNKELVFLDDYYIMNGYNFDFKVYAIKSN